MKHISLVIVSLIVLVCSVAASAATREMVDLEMRRLDQWLESKIRSCPDNTGCISRARNMHSDAIRRLQKDPDAYFYSQQLQRPTQRSTTNGSDRAGGRVDPQTGHFHQRVAGGYIDTATGTFHQDAAGGTINTRTGQFSPSY